MLTKKEEVKQSGQIHNNNITLTKDPKKVLFCFGGGKKRVGGGGLGRESGS